MYYKYKTNVKFPSLHNTAKQRPHIGRSSQHGVPVARAIVSREQETASLSWIG